jgi:type IV secretory pathway VirJ component
VCAPSVTREFVARTGTATFIPLPKVGHGFSVERNWLPQFVASYHQVANLSSPRPTLPHTADLPLVEVPARGAARTEVGELFAVLLTGDGGWAGLDQDLAGELADHGIPVVALNSLKYFWKAREPEGAAHDLVRIIGAYGAHWGRRQVLLIGYSFGADALPFLYDRLDAGTRRAVVGVALLGVGKNASFEIHVGDWIPGHGETGPATIPQIERIRDARVLCVYGRDEQDSPCPALEGSGVSVVALGGGHHFDGDYGALSRQILDFAESHTP